jgi:flagellin-like protein
MKRLLKSKKALSPVVAAIILIAVTVAVSIAVAAWMGALTFTFMQTEELKITSVTFQSGNATLAVTNTGADSLTIASATVDDAAAASGELPMTLVKGQSDTVTVTLAWTSGYKYTFALLTSSGNKYTYTTTAAP